MQTKGDVRVVFRSGVCRGVLVSGGEWGGGEGRGGGGGREGESRGEERLVDIRSRWDSLSSSKRGRERERKKMDK